MPSRVLCLYVPHFRVVIERLRRPELAEVAVVIYRGGKRPLVVEGCARAQEAGVAEGMLLSRALSLCPRATALPADEEAYQQANAALLQPLLRLTDEVEAGELGLAFMSLRGLERLVGDEKAIAQTVLCRGVQSEENPRGKPSAKKGTSLSDCGFSSEYDFPLNAPTIGDPANGGLASSLRLGIATGRFAAEMVARHSGRQVAILPSGKEAAFLARLPLAVLPASDADWREVQRRLRLLGLSTLGEVAALGKVAMQAQFGSVGLAAWRLASGVAAPLRPLPLALEVEAGHQFEAPLCAWPDVEAALAELAADVAGQLRREGWSCAALNLTWQVEGKAEERRRTLLKEPAAATAIMLAAARRCLQEAMQEQAIAENHTADFRSSGPLAELSLRAEALAPQAGKQMNLFAGRKPKGRLEQVALELRQRLGKDALCHVQLLAPNHLEERTYAFQPLATG